MHISLMFLKVNPYWHLQYWLRGIQKFYILLIKIGGRIEKKFSKFIWNFMQSRDMNWLMLLDGHVLHLCVIGPWILNSGGAFLSNTQPLSHHHYPHPLSRRWSSYLIVVLIEDFRLYKLCSVHYHYEAQLVYTF